VSFGDILRDWDNLKKEEGEAKQLRGEAARVRGEAGNSGGEAAEPRPAPKPSTRDQVMAYLNRYGTEDKDLELDRENLSASSAAQERERLARLRPEASIDLHGMTTEAAMDGLRLFLDDSRRKGMRKVLIIHGKGVHSEGDPVLKRAVLRFLERYPGAGRSGAADRDSGGGGATWLILRPS
jgi:DNA-nicking Smr family endonuclease